MASPPFTPNEALPGNTDVVSNFPAVERTFRDIIESWLLSISDTHGHLKPGYLTTANRVADVNFTQGSLIFNTSLGALQVCTTAPSTWNTVSFPSGTRTLFHHTAAPLGWTKDTSAVFNDSALRLVTGSVGNGGSRSFTSTFTGRPVNVNDITQASYGVSFTDPTHAHSQRVTPITVNTVTGSSFVTVNNPQAGGGTTLANGNGAGTGITGLVSIGNPSPTGMDFAVKYADFIIAQKD